MLMKRLRVIGDTLHKARQSPTCPFLAPSIKVTPIRYTLHEPLKHRAPSDRRFISSSGKIRTPAAEAVKKADAPPEPLPTLHNEHSFDSEPSKPSEEDHVHLRGILGAEEFGRRRRNTSALGPSIFSSGSENRLASLEPEEHVSKSTTNGRSMEGLKSMENNRSSILDDFLPSDRRGLGRRTIAPASTDIFGDGDVETSSSLSKPAVKRSLDIDLRLDPYMGRNVPVPPKVPLAQAIRFLDKKLRTNNIKGELMYQRFHERAGLKRKRLKSERWRRRFKEGFRAMVGQAMRMKKQGW